MKLLELVFLQCPSSLSVLLGGEQGVKSGASSGFVLPLNQSYGETGPPEIPG